MLRRLRTLRAPAWVLAADLLIAAVFFAPLLGQLDTAILADDIFIRPGHSDAFNFLWGYWWVQKAMALGVSPFHCTWILPPNGADLRLHTMPLLAAAATYPLGALLGPVAGYNLAVLGLIVGGALAAQWSFRRALRLSWPAAFLAGALFGFAPYFVYQAHSHIHLIGAAFWATALGQVLVAYVRRDFQWRRGIAFAVAVWATLWSSLLEFTMLGLVAATLLALFELAPPAGRPTLRERTRLLAPALLGAVSLLPFLRGGAEHVAVDMYLAVRLRNFLRYPPLSALSPPDVSFVPEFGGMYLPLALAIPALAGALLAWRAKHPASRPLVAAAALCLVLTLDVWRVPSEVLRALPLGAGIRVFSRFYPFFLFFATALAGLALGRLLSAARRRWAPAALLVLGVAGCLAEYAPLRLAPSAVRRLPLPPGVAIDRGGFLLVVPRRDYRNVQDTWAVTLDMRTVKLSFVGREARGERALRERLFPRVYADRLPLEDPATLSELRALGVGYLLLESNRLPRPPWGREVARAGEYCLWSLLGG
jgi:hypothetical protein